MLGAIHKDFRNSSRAVHAYRTALDRTLTPAARSEVLRELAEVLINELGQHREALELLRSVPPEFANQPDILVLQAECLWQLQADKSEAQKLVDEAIRTDPELGPALVMQGKLLLHYEKPHESLAVLEHARRLDPFDHKCRNQLVAAYTLLAREADDEVQQALALQGLADGLVPLGTAPSLPATLTVAAAETRRQTYLFFRDDHMKASQIIVDTLLKLSELSAKAEAELWNAEVRFAIGSIWIQLHRPGMARMWLNAALVCDPQHRGARDALAFLDRQEELRP
jgi:tetratricopeptide (TPR) repeat protein